MNLKIRLMIERRKNIDKKEMRVKLTYLALRVWIFREQYYQAECSWFATLRQSFVNDY